MSAAPDKKRQISVEGPSNIAFVKYWGKTGRQYPMNPSLSMTLKHCVTKCCVTYVRSTNGFSLETYRFAGQSHEKFQNRIETYLRSILDICPVLQDLSLSIETENTFPHSAGIASSASVFASIGMALAKIEQDVEHVDHKSIEQRASELARLGSGSAARSIQGPYSIWGEYNAEKSMNDYASPLADLDPSFAQVKDAILLIDRSEKTVSSSAGHALMGAHPFRQSRITQAQTHTGEIITAMRSGDWEKFGAVLEAEALSLHAMMMTSRPSFILLAPKSLTAMEKIRAFRAQSGLPVYFTIDAGPNIHLIYPKHHETDVEDFIKTDLAALCQDGAFIIDECGAGATVTGHANV